jgi:hypothetical protein
MLTRPHLATALALAVSLLLAACGDLPEPFIGNPGATARKLAVPLTPRLAVPIPTDALLPDAAATTLAAALAFALQAHEVPAVLGREKATDWRLATRAELRGGAVVPVFTVFNPKGEDQGTAEGAPVPTDAWAAGAPAMLQQTATQAAPGITTLLTRIEAARQKADPNSLFNRAAKVMVAPVTGAPGDGNATLTQQMKTKLSGLGPVVQDTETGADFIVQGEVRVVPIPDNQQRVEVQWIVRTAANDERGRVVQLNNIPAGTLDHAWGDVAIVVATEAAGGVRDVVLRQSGHEPGQQPDAQPASSGQPPSAQPGQPASPAVPPSAAQAGLPPASQPGQPSVAQSSQPPDSQAVRGQGGTRAVEGQTSGGVRPASSK